jgi:Tfp pilus assembly protein PilX
MKTGRGQRGAALIAAIFVITALAALGGLMTQMLTLGSTETINEWYSAQALYAAESGVQWSVYNAGASANDQPVVAGSAWFDVNVVATNFGGGKVLYTITSTGKAGGSAANPRTQREIVVQYMP